MAHLLLNIATWFMTQEYADYDCNLRDFEKYNCYSM